MDSWPSVTKSQLPEKSDVYWSYEVGNDEKHMITLGRRKSKDAYLTFYKAIVFPGEKQKLFDVTPQTVVNLFKMEYSAELSKARVKANINQSFDKVEIVRAIPITADLNELGFLNTVEEMLEDENTAWCEMALCMTHAATEMGMLPSALGVALPSPSPSNTVSPTPVPKNTATPPPAYQ